MDFLLTYYLPILDMLFFCPGVSIWVTMVRVRPVGVSGALFPAVLLVQLAQSVESQRRTQES